MPVSTLFKPVEALFGRFSLPGKIVVLGGAFMLTVLVLYGFFLRQHLTSLDFSRSEKLGVAVIEPLVAVSEALREHRARRAVLPAEGRAAESGLADARRRVDDALGGMSAHDDALERLGLALRWRSIGQAWARLAAVAGSNPARDYDAHAELLAQVEGLIVEAADRSNLTLDPDIDSYYLMDAAAFRLPGLIEAASKGGHLAAGMAAGGTLDMAARIELAGTLAVFRDNLAALRDGMVKVSQVNPTLDEQMSGEVAAFLRDGDAIVGGLFDRAVLPQRVEIGPDQSRRLAQAAASSGGRLWSSALLQLDGALERRIDAMQYAFWEVTAFVLAVLAIAVYLFLALRTAVGRNASTIAEAAARMAAGDLSNRVECSGKDEFAAIAAALNGMRQSLQQSIARDREVAVENLRIRNALDRASVNLMLADAEGRIIYMNDSVARMLAGAEAEIRKRLPTFSVDSLIGRNFDDFHRDPAHQRGILETLEGTHAAQIEVGPYSFLLKASPVIDAVGQRLGSVLEWNDRTAEVAAEKEMAGLVEAAIEGDFDHRLSLDGKQGFIRQLAEGMNRLTGVVASAIEEVGLVMNAMARGDLTRTIESEFAGSLGQLKGDVNASVAQLRTLVSRIQNSADAIKSASEEISAGNIDLSARTEQQASSLQETASSMEELNATVQQNAENAARAFELAAASDTVAERGGQMMSRVVANMDSIQDASRKIAEIIGVIDSIAFQTNILALNAAVEAARAGQQGRGFAVVASEVRCLAQRSAEAAKEIKGLIDDSVGRVGDGAGLVDQTGKTMAEIVGNIHGLTGLVTGIAEASKEQSSGIGQVTRAVGQMDEVTQQNAALVEQAAAASESLQEQALALVEAVGAFRLDAVAAAVPADTDFDQIVDAHSRWTGRLRDYVADKGERLDPAVVERDDECALGGWIRGPGQRYAQDPSFVRLRAAHADFHRCAAKIVRLHDNGDKNEAERLLRGDFSRLDSATAQEIRGLRAHVECPPAALPVEMPRRVAGKPTAIVKPGRSAISVAALQDEWEEF